MEIGSNFHDFSQHKEVFIFFFYIDIVLVTDNDCDDRMTINSPTWSDNEKKSNDAF